MPASTIQGRLRKLQQRMLDIRCGTGAMILPKNVKRLHLRFAPKFNNGHLGPRKFWHNEMVRLKYHNPAVQMTVERNAAQEETPILSIHFTESKGEAKETGSEAASTADATNEAPTTRVETIDCQNRTNGYILQALIDLTKPIVIGTSPQDEALRVELAQQWERNEQGRKAAVEKAAEAKKQENMIKQAREML